MKTHEVIFQAKNPNTGRIVKLTGEFANSRFINDHANMPKIRNS